MGVYDDCRAMVEQKASVLEGTVEAFREKMLNQIKEAESNEILAAIKSLGARLTAIEARLPEPEAPDEL